MKKYILITALSLISGVLHSKTLELKKNTGTILIKEKSNWKLSRDLFGMPFIYFSPSSSGQRSNISFSDTGAELQLEIKALAKSQDTYQDGRKKWAKTVGAEPISFEPYGVKINNFGHTIHQIGFSYAHENKVYFEKTYFIECKGKLIYSKSLRLSENEVHDKDFNDLINDLDCGGV